MASDYFCSLHMDKAKRVSWKVREAFRGRRKLQRMQSSVCALREKLGGSFSHKLTWILRSEVSELFVLDHGYLLQPFVELAVMTWQSETFVEIKG